MEFDYVVVQAGGKGTRLENLTSHKPKALVSVHNRPMLFHLFDKFPQKKFIIIGDYKFDVMEKYLNVFAPVEYELINANGKKGTCSGLNDSLVLIPENKAFMLVWCDLVLPTSFPVDVERKESQNLIGISKDFSCRWKWENNIFSEEPSTESGVAGLFLFEDKKVLNGLPIEGEFVRWLGTTEIVFKELPLNRTKEFGILSALDKENTMKCRPFNKITIKGNRLIKEGIDDQGKMLAIREKNWYRTIQQFAFKYTPSIYSFDPLEMELIQGQNIYELGELDFKEKKVILDSIMNSIDQLHHLKSIESNNLSCEEAYFTKTYERIDRIKDLVPFAHEQYICINGKQCPNIFYFKDQIEKEMKKYFPETFHILHGDCTFSNIICEKNNIKLIDPRGYFGGTELFGDIAYDWAKLYYSIVGNYDQFNLKHFQLEIGNTITLEISSNHWEDLERYFFEKLPNSIDPTYIKWIHAIIWISLSTYAWDDYDSICGAFYNGLYYLEELL